mmetsp:Transcript_28538/g.53499  ORF Transcript_28538/g.53499 Transcript_28538/m.53499 type:complete len:85 (-) Transcript_28538:612-866(-)
MSLLYGDAAAFIWDVCIAALHMSRQLRTASLVFLGLTCVLLVRRTLIADYVSRVSPCPCSFGTSLGVFQASLLFYLTETKHGLV